MKSFVGNKKLLAVLLATLFFAKASTPLFADEIDPELDVTVEETEFSQEELYGEDEALFEEADALEEVVIPEEDIIVEAETPAPEAPVVAEPIEIQEKEEIASEVFQSEFERYGSLFDRFPAIFSRRNFCIINTVSNPEETSVSLYNPEKAQIRSLSLKKRNNFDDRGLWTKNIGGKEIPGIQVTQQTIKFFDCRLKINTKYDGYRKHVMGIALEKLLGQTKKYKGTLLIDEYKHFPIWNVVLKDRTELHAFLAYLGEQNLRSRGTEQFDKKPVLRLTLESDPFLEDLELEDISLISSFFHLVDFNDAESMDFINKILGKIRTTTLQFESSSPIYIGESVAANTLRGLESYFEKFDPKDMTKAVIRWTGGVIATGLTVALVSYIWNSQKHKAKEDLVGKGKKVAKNGFAKLKTCFKNEESTPATES